MARNSRATAAYDLLERHAEVLGLQRTDSSLKVVTLLAGDSDLIACHLVRQGLDAKTLQELTQLLGMVRR